MAAKDLLTVDACHVVKAYDEMSNSNIVQVMKGLRKLEILILIALYLENAKVEKVPLEPLQERAAVIMRDMRESDVNRTKGTMFTTDIIPEDEVKYGNWQRSFLTTSMFREIIKRLQAFGLIRLDIEAHKLTDNAHVSHLNFFDYCDLKNAYEKNEIWRVQNKSI